MAGLKRFLLLLLLLSFSFAAITESGDAGKEFAKNATEYWCDEENVQAVYTCLANVVRVVSSVPGEGSTFHKPEGKIIRCPDVPSPQLGAECLSMMVPNYCPSKAECGNSSAPEVFPGQGNIPAQDGTEVQNVTANETTDTVVKNETVAVSPKKPKPNDGAAVNGDIEVTPNAPLTSPDALLGYLVPVVFILGVTSIGVLFMLFRNSIDEDET